MDDFSFDLDGDDEERLRTAYHEAGHCVIGILMGARVRFASIEVESEDHFGEVEMEWPHGSNVKAQALAILAGPVAEMTDRDEPFSNQDLAPSKADFQQVLQLSQAFGWTHRKQVEWIQHLITQLYRQFKRPDCWAAVAAVSDQLLAHDTLEHETIADEVSHWMRVDQG
jgi:hypothetical protein